MWEALGISAVASIPIQHVTRRWEAIVLTATAITFSFRSRCTLDLGLLLLVGPLLLDLEWLLEPDLAWEEDIIKVLLAVNRKEIKITTFFQNMITEAICLKLHYIIKYSRKLQFTIEHFHSILVCNITKYPLLVYQ